MLSPSQQFSREGDRTLQFALSCKLVKNEVKKNKYTGSIPAGMPFTASKTKTTAQKLKQTKQPWDQKLNISSSVVKTTLGLCPYFQAGNSDSKPFILLPIGSNMHHIMSALTYSGYQVFAIDPWTYAGMQEE